MMTSREPVDPPVNPYAPPASDIHAAPQVDPKLAELAERLSRLGASVLDSFLVLIAVAPALISTWSDFANSFRTGVQVSNLWWIGRGPGQLAATFLLLALVGCQSYLVATTGQSIGKRVARVRIVQTNDRPTEFVHGVLLRYWLFQALRYIPVAGPILGLVDVLFIFRADRRCLHDLVADTKVIRA